MAFNNPTTDEFKAYFFRDFPYGSDINTSVTDQDIMNALSDADVNINQGLFMGQAAYTTAFLLLSAHYMVLSLRASSQGIAGQYNFLQGSKGVGSVSESFNIPQRILDNPEFSMLCKTNYGAKYLGFILPLLSGQIFTVCGGTQP